jgi:hypothetical protein
MEKCIRINYLCVTCILFYQSMTSSAITHLQIKHLYIIKGKRWFFVGYVLEICSLEVNLFTCKQCLCTHRLLLAWVFTRKYNLMLNLSMNSSEDSRSLFLERKSHLGIPPVLWSSSWFRRDSAIPALVSIIKGKDRISVCSRIWRTLCCSALFQRKHYHLDHDIRHVLCDIYCMQGYRSSIKFVIHFMYIDCTYILVKKIKTTHRKLMSSWPIRMTLLATVSHTSCIITPLPCVVNMGYEKTGLVHVRHIYSELK